MDKIYSVVSRNSEGEPLAVLMTVCGKEAADFRDMLITRGHKFVSAYEATPLTGGLMNWVEAQAQNQPMQN